MQTIRRCLGLRTLAFACLSLALAGCPDDAGSSGSTDADASGVADSLPADGAGDTLVDAPETPDTQADAADTAPDPPDTAPDGGPDAPDADDATPDGGDATPDGGDATPDVGDATPDVGDAAPDVGDAAPDAGDATPDAPTPDADAATPDADDTAEDTGPDVAPSCLVDEDCDDGLSCTVDTCDPVAGCVFALACEEDADPCTIVGCAVPAASLSSCADLGLTASADTPAVCATALVGADAGCAAGPVGLTAAWEVCDGLGMRLCTAGELAAGAADGAGCPELAAQAVWTATACGDGAVTRAGTTDPGDLAFAPPRCADPGETALPLCCADVAPADVVGTCHVVGVAPAACEDGDPCTLDACTLDETGGCVHDATGWALGSSVSALPLPSWLGPEDRVGNAVAVGDGFIAATAPGVVRVEVYRRTLAGWQWEAELQSPDDVDWAAHIGYSVAAAGDRIAVGLRLHEPQYGVGVLVFDHAAGAWAQVGAVVLPVDADLLPVPPVSVDGDRVLLSKSQFVSGAQAGAAWILEPEPAGGGWSVATALVPDDAAGSVNYGWRNALSGDTAVVCDPLHAESAGRAHVFERQPDGAWEEVAVLAPADLVAGDQFCGAVSLQGDRLAVSAEKQAPSGAVYIFQRAPADGTWAQVARLAAPDPELAVQFGSAVALAGARLAVADAKRHDGRGMVHLFEGGGDGTAWPEIGRFDLPDAAPEHQFGYRLAAAGSRLATSTTYFDDALGATVARAYAIEAAICDDGNPCTSDTCDPALGCAAAPLGDGTPCSDGDSCNGEEVCTGGACAAGTPLDCSGAGDPCTVASCDPTLGCVSEPVVCEDDGIACTTVACVDGACQATPDDALCGEPSGCVAAFTCDIAAGGCVPVPATPGAACALGDACAAGTCEAATASASTCAELGWEAGPGLTTVCAASDVAGGACAGEVTHEQAVALCDALGARLCSLEELEREVDLGACGGGYVWSSTPCDAAGTQWWGAFGGGSASTYATCQGNTKPRGVRCCADADPAAPAPACVMAKDTIDEACPDDGPCQRGRCEPFLGCMLSAVTGADCEADGIPCTADTCQGGTCEVGEPVDALCDGWNGCAASVVCDVEAGGCRAVPAAVGAACMMAEDCGTGVCEATAISASTCGELGWDTARGWTNVCSAAEVDGGACSEPVTFGEAQALCEGLGARLCTLGELQRETVPLECGEEETKTAWSSSACSASHNWSFRYNADGDTVVTCGNVTTATRAVRCCADADPATAAPACAVTDASASAECPVEGGCKGAFCRLFDGCFDQSFSGVPCDDDGLACTEGTCDLGTCVEVPDDALCADGPPCTGAGACDPAMGCVYAPGLVGDPCATGCGALGTCAAPEVSAATCTELGWDTSMGASDAVCGASKFPDCLEDDSTFDEAAALCAGQGARLCTAAELQANETIATGCNLDWQRIWTSTPCDVGAVLTQAGHTKHLDTVPPECTPWDTAEVFTRCCADETPGTALACQTDPAAWSAPCRDGSACTVDLCGPEATCLTSDAAGVCQGAGCAPEIFFSEIVEGSGDLKALEIYNGTGATVDMTTVQVLVLQNPGVATGWADAAAISMKNTLADGETYVVCGTLLPGGSCDIVGPVAVGFNGNDPRALVRDGVIVDRIGDHGLAPAEGWEVAGIPAATKDHTLRRKPTVHVGTDDWPSAAATEWEVLPLDTLDGLGSHTITCD